MMAGMPFSIWHNISFTDAVFLFAFLPVVVAGFAMAARRGSRWGAVWLVAASLAFFASWGRAALLLLCTSLLVNAVLRDRLVAAPAGSALRRRWLWAVLAANLGFLCYYKYRVFVVSLWAADPTRLAPLVIPLGISFYTFQQIILAVDAYRGSFTRDHLLSSLYVVFFPHLVAGPLVHHREVMAQFRKLTFRWRWAAAGVMLFSIGLFKKVCLADPLAPLAAAAFDGGAAASVQFWRAWVGAVAYTLQIYFDFSGYSEMAMGLARLFGVRLPVNFNSPYRARNIVDFWRRWHLTLSRFLREYIYIPLGGNRQGPLRRYANLIVVMLLGGLWHGAGWTFVLWGGLHGFYLVVNHAWAAFRSHLPTLTPALGRLESLTARLLTLAAVIFAWVPFRADGMGTAVALWKAMLGLSGAEPFPQIGGRTLLDIVVLPMPVPLATFMSAGVLAVLLLLAATLPNALQLMRALRPFPGPAAWAPRQMKLRWRATSGWGLLAGLLVGLALMVGRTQPKVFLYWNF